MGYFIVTHEEAEKRRAVAERNRKMSVFFGSLYAAMSFLALVMAVVSVIAPETFIPYAVFILIGAAVFAAVRAVISFRQAREFADSRKAIKAVWSGTVGRPSKETVR